MDLYAVPLNKSNKRPARKLPLIYAAIHRRQQTSDPHYTQNPSPPFLRTLMLSS